MSQPSQETVSQSFDALIAQLDALRESVDPGHIPMIAYLRRLRSRVCFMQDEFNARCDTESGARSR